MPLIRVGWLRQLILSTCPCEACGELLITCHLTKGKKSQFTCFWIFAPSRVLIYTHKHIKKNSLYSIIAFPSCVSLFFGYPDIDFYNRYYSLYPNSSNVDENLLWLNRHALQTIFLQGWSSWVPRNGYTALSKLCPQQMSCNAPLFSIYYIWSKN